MNSERLQVYLISYVGMSLLLSLLAAAGPRGGADAGALSRAPRPHARRARDGVHDHEPARRAAAPHRAGQGAASSEYAGGRRAARRPTDVIVPASFNFPHTGKLLSLSFVLFAGLVRRRARAARTDYPRLAEHRAADHVRQRQRRDPCSCLTWLRIPADTFQPVRDVGHRQRQVRHARGGHAHAGRRRARDVRDHADARVRRSGRSIRFAIITTIADDRASRGRNADPAAAGLTTARMTRT